MTAFKTRLGYALVLFCCSACVSPSAGMAQAKGPEQFNGASAPTGTQGVVGNPNCPPPTVYTENGAPITPLNWSCDSSGYWPSRSPYTGAPMEVHHPGPIDPSDPANPCLVKDHDYDWRNNPPGTYLPAGCLRPSNGAARTIYPPSRGQYQPINHRFRSPAPVPPPGEIDPEGEFPGKYVVPSSYPGEYLGPNGEPPPAGQLINRRPDLPLGHMPPEIYIQRIPQMPFGRISPGR
jgi:hypothetical protein